mgnify:CR=1 FL=1
MIIVLIKKAIFFDRDGTLIETFVTKDLIPKAIQSLDQFKLCSYAKFVVNRLSKHFLIIIITNQRVFRHGFHTKSSKIPLKLRYQKAYSQN